MPVSRGKIDFDHVGIGEALTRNRLAVPLNQREYRWEEKQVLDLFHDLGNAINTNKASYFLGTIVLTPGQDGVLELVDGQQRLATTTILLAAIRDYFHDGLHDELLVTSLEQFLFTIVRETRETVPRLKLNVDDNEFFRTRILLRSDEPRRKKIKATKPSHHKLERAAKLAAQHIQDVLKPHSKKNHVEYLNVWVSFIEQSAQVILAKCPDDVNAFVMFETLNDRGLKTSQSDLLKNYLFAQAGDRINEAQQRWASMTGTLESLGDDEDISITYLRHFSISLYGHTREREVLQKIRAEIAGRLKAVEFLDALMDSAKDYVALQTPGHAKWNSYSPSLREHLRTMGLLGVVPLRPVMLSVVQRFGRQQAEKAFRLFVSWAVRLLIVGGARSGSVEESFGELAKNVKAGKINTAEKLAEAVVRVVPSDTEFEAGFATARVSKNQLARYYLRALELKRKGHPEPEWIPNEAVVINLEHILPENPGSGWPEFDSETAPAYCRRIGNIALLKASKNSLVGNTAFSKKRKVFKKSAYVLTAEIAKYSSWGPKEIDERQRKLAQIAVETWPLAF